MCGIITHRGRITEATGVLGWAQGKELDFVLAYFNRKGWEYEFMEDSYESTN